MLASLPWREVMGEDHSAGRLFPPQGHGIVARQPYIFEFPRTVYNVVAVP